MVELRKTAFIFPGQGSQCVGMGRSLYESFPASREVFEEANQVLGYDLKRVAFEGPREELDRTEVTQPALLTASVAALRALAGVSRRDPDFYAGHSLGEYTALVAAGSLDFRDAVRIVSLRGKFMQESVPPGEGRMCAVLGLDAKRVEEVVSDASRSISLKSGKDMVAVAANINSPEQVVISGHWKAVEEAERLAKEAGAKRVIPLPVSVPSHSPLMTGAAERLRNELEKVHLKAPRAPVITNVAAAPVTEPSLLRDMLTRQLTGPVRWVETVRRMKAEEVGLVVEIGPGRVLTGLVKRIEPELETINLSEAQDLEKAAERLFR